MLLKKLNATHDNNIEITPCHSLHSTAHKIEIIEAAVNLIEKFELYLCISIHIIPCIYAYNNLYLCI